ncbi:MAG: ATP-binding protein, partial [Myxococcota bacterium]
MRGFHSIKGAARAANAKMIESLCHQSETSLSPYRAGDTAVPLELIDQLATTLNEMRSAGESLRKHGVEKTEKQTSSGGESSTVRIDGARLDRLLTRSSELHVRCGRLEELSGALEELRALVAGDGNRERVREELTTVRRTFDRERRELLAASVELDRDVRNIRQLPFLAACRGLERAAMDAARTYGRQVDLNIVEDAEIDRSVVEAIRSPLLHLVRNAVAHGIEDPDERTRRGKSVRGTVRVSAEVSGRQVLVTVADDGRGIEIARIQARADALNLPRPETVEEASALLLSPGFSTAKQVDEIAGRGVGLDVVHREITAMHGQVLLDSTPGSGMSITLRLPLTLRVLRMLNFSAGSERYAIPTNSVQRLLRLRHEDMFTVDGSVFTSVDDEEIEVEELTRAVGGASPVQASERFALVLTAAGTSRAFLVDDVEDENEAIVRELGPWLEHAPLV